MSKKYRYPGVQPFNRSYQELFFGRAEDSKELIRRINLENLLIFYGKSGLGKTSLLNASVIPELEKTHNYKPLLLRFNNYDEASDLTPGDIFVQAMEGMADDVEDLDSIPVAHVTLWQALKKLQLSNEKYAGGSFMLVFDQFEEFFTYPEGTEQFAMELSDLLNGRVPKEFRKNLRRALAVDETLQEKLTEERRNKLLEPLDVKVVISIRSDRLSLLDQIKVHIPDILKNTYELTPLNADQAREAIVKPAQLPGDFISPQFEYTEDTLQKIICFLQKDCGDSKKRKEPVESFQLQIICRHIETNIVEGEIKPEGETIVVDPEDIDINLDSILEAYYESEISKLSEKEQKAARELIEDGLILADEQRRISLDRGVLKSRFPQVTNQLLKKLVGMHILRAEPNNFGSVSYELSHDTLVEPILRKKREREQEEKLRQEQLKKEQEAEERMRQEKLKQKRILNRTILIAAIVVMVLMAGALYYLKKAYDQEAQARRDLVAANDSIKKLTSTRMGQLQLQIRELKNELKHDSIRFAREKRNMIQTRDELVNIRDTKIMELERRLKKRNQRVAKLEEQVIRKTNQIDSLSNAVKQLNREVESKRKRINSLSKNLEAKNKRVSELEGLLQRSKETLSSTQNDLQTLRRQKNNLQENLNRQKKQVARLEETESRLRDKLASAQKKSQQLQQRLNKLSASNEKLKEQINKIKRQKEEQ